MRGWLKVFTVAVAAIAAAPATARAQDQASETRAAAAVADWPVDAEPLRSLVSGWAQRQADEGRLQAAPDGAEAIHTLLRLGRIDDAFAALARVIHDQPDQMADGFTAFVDLDFSDRAHDRASQVLPLLDAGRKRLDALPREAQAVAAFAMLRLEGSLTMSAGDAWKTRYRALRDTYAGTATVELMAVDDAATPLDAAALSRLEALAAAHPGTVMAARARYLRGFHLAHNAGFLTLGQPKVDPTDRFLTIIAIATDLERGGYPPCEWTAKAPELLQGIVTMPGFGPPASLERVAPALVDYARVRAAVHGSEDGFAIAARIVGLAGPAGPARPALDRALEDLARIVTDPAVTRYVEAFAALHAYDGKTTPDARRLARQWLDEAAAMGDGAWARRSRAWRAELAFADGQWADAQARFDEFERRYPQSDFAWMALVRAGQSALALGRRDDAWTRFQRAAHDFPASPFAHVLGRVLSARLLEREGRPDRALDEYREAATAWIPALGATLDAMSVPPSEDFQVRMPDPGRIVRTAVLRRLEQLSTFLPQPGGLELEQARWLHLQERHADAIAALEPIVRARTGTPVGAEAAALVRRARLEAALALAGSPSSRASRRTAARQLAALAKEPFDASVGIAGVTAATLQMLDGGRAAATATMEATLRRWVAAGARLAPPPAGSLEADVLAIRDLVFQPLGKGPLAGGWNAFEWPKRLPKFLVAPAALQVTIPGRTGVTPVDVSRQPPGLSNVLFIGPDDLEALTLAVSRLGGTDRREPETVMETPNQPIGDADRIITWWNGFFAARPGHWMGFEIVTYPAFGSIEFADAGRTRASVPVTVGYSGATLMLRKTNGVWQVVDVVNVWET